MSDRLLKQLLACIVVGICVPLFFVIISFEWSYLLYEPSLTILFWHGFRYFWLMIPFIFYNCFLEKCLSHHFFNVCYEVEYIFFMHTYFYKIRLATVNTKYYMFCFFFVYLNWALTSYLKEKISTWLDTFLQKLINFVVAFVMSHRNLCFFITFPRLTFKTHCANKFSR